MKRFALFLLLMLALGGCEKKEKSPAWVSSYPSTRRDESNIDTYFDGNNTVRVVNPYGWMETPSSEVSLWANQQNALTDTFLSHLPQRKIFRDRLDSLSNYEKFGVPTVNGGYYFYLYNSGLQNHSVLVREDSLSNRQMILDPNTFGPGKGMIKAVVSPNGRYVAYGVSDGGSDSEEIHVLDVKTGKDLPEQIPRSFYANFAWTPDSKGFYYSRYPRVLMKQNRLLYHVVGTNPEYDRLVLLRLDKPDWHYSPIVTKDGNYLIITIRHGTDNKNRIYYKRRGSRNVVALLDSANAGYEFIGNHDDVFYFRTNWNAPRYQVIAIDINRPESNYWKTFIKQGPIVMNSVTMNAKRFMVTYLVNARTDIYIFNEKGNVIVEPDHPTFGTATGAYAHPTKPEFYFEFSSFVNPPTIMKYDLADSGYATLRPTPFKQPTQDFDQRLYSIIQPTYRSKDGTEVRIFILSKRGIKLNGDNPVFLFGYGGFGVSMLPVFSPIWQLWLEQGGMIALPSIRGGGECGEEWHEAGKRTKKQNVFDDFIAAAEYLIQRGYTCPEKLAIYGASNGGLLVLACLTQRPELFGAVVANVPLTDMLKYHRFYLARDYIPEYGCADSAADFGYLYQYSPLHNVRRGRYPATFITTGEHDERAAWWHGGKMAATLQWAQGGTAPIRLRVQPNTGHGLAQPANMYRRRMADTFTFISQALKMKVKKIK